MCSVLMLRKNKRDLCLGPCGCFGFKGPSGYKLTFYPLSVAPENLVPALYVFTVKLLFIPIQCVFHLKTF